MKIEETLRLTATKGASDVHLMAGDRPAFRVHGQLHIDGDLEPVTAEQLALDLEGLVGDQQMKEFRRELELDFAVEIAGAGRFRGNAALERGGISLVFRRITELLLDMDSLGLPPICRDLATRPRGLVIITGQAGSGKSTTLAAMIEHINSTTSSRIVTLEDPIEYVFHNKRSVITQRQVGDDTRSFAAALNHVLRQNPDVIMVGEMRDAATVAAALTAAETGHLVLTTAHAPGAPLTIDRMIDMFPPHQQGQVRSQLAAILEGVLYQQLVRKADGGGRTAAVEIMLGSSAVRNLVREGKTHQLYAAIQMAGGQGMRTLDHAVLRLYQAGTITKEAAMAHAQNREQVEKDLQAPRSLTGGKVKMTSSTSLNSALGLKGLVR